MFFQNGLTGEAWGDWSLYTDSPLRALTSAQECIAGTGGPFPEDFWDPAGITAKKSRLDLDVDVHWLSTKGLLECEGVARQHNSKEVLRFTPIVTVLGKSWN